MKKNFILLTAIFSITLCSCTRELTDFKSEKLQNQYSCEYRGRTRRFIICLPEEQDANTKLVVMLHGYGSNGQSFQRDTGFEKDALPKNVAVLYVSGEPVPNVKTSSTGWNYMYNKYGKNDMDFIADLTLWCQKQYGLSKEAYVVGFSNGSFMANKLAIEKARYYKGVISVGGMMPDLVWKSAHKKIKKHAVRYFQINGTKDDVTPMRLNDSAKYNPHPAMEDVIEFYCDINKAGKDFIEDVVNEKITITKYENKVWWMLIKNYPHSWPSQRFCKININEFILDFIFL